jgi:hypothetical protein
MSISIFRSPNLFEEDYPPSAACSYPYPTTTRLSCRNPPQFVYPVAIPLHNAPNSPTRWPQCSPMFPTRLPGGPNTPQCSQLAYPVAPMPPNSNPVSLPRPQPPRYHQPSRRAASNSQPPRCPKPSRRAASNSQPPRCPKPSRHAAPMMMSSASLQAAVSPIYRPADSSTEALTHTHTTPSPSCLESPL